MALCKHCQVDSTLSADGQETCPHCGMPFEFTDDDWDLDISDGPRADSPEDTASETDDLSAGEETAAMSDLDDPNVTAPLGGIDSDNLAGREAAVDMTISFGDDFDDEDDWDDEDALALEESVSELSLDDEQGTAGPGDITAPFIDLDSGTPDSGHDTDREPETDRMSPEATIAFDAADSDAANSDVGAGTGPDPGLGGQTLAHGEATPESARSHADDSATGGSGSAGSGSAGSALDSDQLGTLPAGLSGSDRGSGGVPDTRGEDIGSRGGDSGTLAVDGDSDRRSDRVETPKPREITGLESGQTIPRGVMGDDRASQSLRPGDTHVVGPENVRLRAYRLGKDENRGPQDFVEEEGPFQGGMGVVYGMRQGSLDRRVAVKQVKPEMSSNESDRNKFISEAVITGQLEHPNIIPVHDLGLAADGLPFYSMKFVEGDEWEKKVKQLSEDENLAILIQVSQAIAFAHSRGILHRDLKPGNVMLGDYGEVLVMDWGLAARLSDVKEVAPSGTPVYMPPETALQYLDYAKAKMGKKRDESSTRRVPAGTYSDIYLLGGLLFKIVTGRAPHRGKTTFECLKAAARNDIVKTSKRSELLDIAYKAMRTDPGERHRDVNEFIDEIRAYQAHAQSNQIAKQAYADLKAAEQAKEDSAVDSNTTYASYSSAQHGFRNALELWEGNRRAARRLVETKRKYAETAYGNGDFDLALSLLDTDSSDDAELITEIRGAQSQRNRRLQLFRTLQYAVAASLVVALGFIGLSVVLGYDAVNQRREAAKAVQAKAAAEAAKTEAERLTIEAVGLQKQAEQEKEVAEVAAKTALMAKTEAEREAKQADIAKAEALRLAKAAENSERLAKQREQAAIAQEQVAIAKEKKARQDAEQQQYTAVLNGVRSTLAERGAYAAWRELRDDYGPERDQELIGRGPEWKNLLGDVNWQAEATEELAGLATPLVSTSRDGSVAVVVNNAAAPSISTYRNGDFNKAIRSWPIDAVAESVQVSPDGRLVAIVGGGGVALYSTDGGRYVLQNSGDFTVTSLAFDPAGDRLFTGDAQTGVARWRIDTANNTAALVERDDQWHQSPVSAVGYSPDGGLRFAADEEGHITVWRGNGDSIQRWSYNHTRAATGSPVITAAAIADLSDGGALAYGCRDGAVYVLRGPWSKDNASQPSEPRRRAGFVSLDLSTGGWINERPDKLNTLHASAVTSVAFADGGQFVISTGGPRGLVRNASPESTRSVKRIRELHDSRILAAAVAASGVVLTSDEEGRVVRWSVDTPPGTARLEPKIGEPRGPVTTIGVVPDQASVVVGDGLGFVRRWAEPFATNAYDRRFAGHADHRRMRAWLAADGRIVTVGADRLACVWDATTGQIERTLDLDGRHVVTLSADRRSLIAATDVPMADKPAAVTFPLNGRPATPLWADNPRVATIHAFRRPKGGEEIFAVGLRDGQLYLWTPTRGRVKLVPSTSRPHWRQIRAITYDPQRDTLFAADNAGLLSRWDLSSGVVTEEFLPGKGVTRRLQVSAQGGLLVVRDELSSTSVDLIDGETLQRLPSGGIAREDLRDATFAADGKTLLSTTKANTIMAWSGGAWRTVEASGVVSRAAEPRGAITGIRAAADGRVLIFGDGHAELWSNLNRDARLLSRVVSRTRPLAAAPDAAGGASALSQQGWLDAWASGEAVQLAPTRSPATSAITAACSAGAGLSFVAVEDNRSSSIELRDLITNQASNERYRVTSGRVASLSSNQAWLAAAIAEPRAHRVELFSRDRGQKAIVQLSKTPVAIAVDPAGERLAAVLATGEVAYATRRGDAWRTGLLDRDAITAVAFTPEGDRLLIGDADGHLAMLAVDPPQQVGEPFTTRVVLTFDGHSDAVSVLRFATLDGRPTLLSGDRSGAVLVKSL